MRGEGGKRKLVKRFDKSEKNGDSFVIALQKQEGRNDKLFNLSLCRPIVVVHHQPTLSSKSEDTHFAANKRKVLFGFAAVKLKKLI